MQTFLVLHELSYKRIKFIPFTPMLISRRSMLDFISVFLLDLRRQCMPFLFNFVCLCILTGNCIGFSNGVLVIIWNSNLITCNRGCDGRRSQSYSTSWTARGLFSLDFFCIYTFNLSMVLFWILFNNYKTPEHYHTILEWLTSSRSIQ